MGVGQGSLLGQLAHSINYESSALSLPCSRSFLLSIVSIVVLFISCLALYFSLFLKLC